MRVESSFGDPERLSALGTDEDLSAAGIRRGCDDGAGDEVGGGKDYDSGACDQRPSSPFLPRARLVAGL
jgi:hypothetical protein